MSRPWQRIYWIEADPKGPGRDQINDAWWEVFRTVERDKEYRIAFDWGRNMYAVYVRTQPVPQEPKASEPPPGARRALDKSDDD